MIINDAINEDRFFTCMLDNAWENYKRKTLERFMNDTTIAGYAITNKEKFVNKIKTDKEFAKLYLNFKQ
jgi:hypothetical protein